ncbi:hypothetical protein JMJ35_008667 [Cladonia borealis]|uniref:Uncharacterized protein n=1 Tax=Cladonia borealis TaxID=184061 RepID=A0AA39QVP7_9LECA|nr:hypothetical protein JMJ35_008667 [Cladonia borealis]
MPRPKRTLAEVDTNTEPAPAAKKALTGRGKAKGKENEVPMTKKAPITRAATKKSTASKAKKAPSKKAKDNDTMSENEALVTDKIPVPIAATIIQNALRAKKAASEKAKDNRTDSPVPQIAPAVEVADIGEIAEAESAKAVTAAAKSNAEKNDGVALPKSKKSVPASKSKSATKASNTKKTATSSKASSTAKDKDGRVSRNADGKTWICICRPASETAKEQDLDPDDEDTVDTCGGGKKCLCFRAADDHPEHKWIVTKKGFELMKKWMVQADKRDPDLFDMHIFEDFYGYGICELIENMFLAFDKEHGKKTQDPVAMWSIMESMALFFMNCDLMTWHMISDSEGNAKRMMLIGTALLTTIDVLISHGLFTNTSPKIRNLGLILSLFLQFAGDVETECNEHGWKHVIWQKADAHDVTIEGLVRSQELVQSIRDIDYASNISEEEDLNEMDPEDLAMYMSDRYESRHTCVELGEKRSWKQYDWDIELEAYRITQAFKVGDNGTDFDVDDIGGNYYDLTAKRNKGAHMKQYKLGEPGRSLIQLW